MQEQNEHLPLLTSTARRTNDLSVKSTLSWLNICVESLNSSFLSQSSISKGNESDRLLLNNLSGQAKPGEILAIMGTSGAGNNFYFD